MVGRCGRLLASGKQTTSSPCLLAEPTKASCADKRHTALLATAALWMWPPRLAGSHMEAGDGRGPPLKYQEPQAVWQRELRQPLIQLPLQQAAGAGCLSCAAAQQ